MTNSQTRWRASKEIQHRARELRKNMTPAEQKLWQVLRGNQLDGLYFRRQHAVGSYIVDFFVHRKNWLSKLMGVLIWNKKNMTKNELDGLKKKKAIV